MLMRRLISGFTMIELLIGIVVLALLLGLGAPSFMVWMQNAQIRNAADAVLNGMQLARTEAIRRNKPVQFSLRIQSGWDVTIVNPSADDKVQVCPTSSNPCVVQTRTRNEGSANVNVAATPGGSYAVTFDAMGGPTSNPDGSLTITSLDFASSVSTDAPRPLRIVVSLSGTIRMCDPNATAGDPRGCS
jgi:type IV fimbrial biogenesis protein FimT